MTQTDQWILCLALVYGAPSFFSGVGVTLLFVRWRDRRRAQGTAPSRQAADDPFEGANFTLPQLFEDERLIGL